MSAPVTFVWPGDLHLDHPGRDNHRAALWMADEVSSLISPDFVQFAGDNVQHARDEEFALFNEVTSRLTVPWHALVGDHDAHHDPGALAFQSRYGATYKAYSMGGFRFICLNSMQFKPLGISPEQLLWFRYELDGAVQRGERIVLFQHHYPFQIWEDFLSAPGMAAWRKLVQTRPIHAVFSGHTHYGQMANDAHTVYVATRSIGEPEGGPAGYAVVTLDDDRIAVSYRSVEDRGPLVQIVDPRRSILALRASHIVSGPSSCRVRIWSAESIDTVEGQVDSGDSFTLRSTGKGWWEAALDAALLPKGEHALEVRATDTTGAVGRETVRFVVDRTGRFNPVPAVDPQVSYTKFC
jgi:3',5'-cyclic-AMP phosphodiesterase